jgi:hypothetical protein
MVDAHATHATVEAGAAVVLSLGGSVVLTRAWLDRRATSSPWIRPTAGRSPGAMVRRAGRYAAGALSAGAAAIHVAAGPAHVEELGDFGLAFYWAALFQAGLALILLTGRVSPGVVRAGILGNAALVAVWAWSRTGSLPFPTGGPEAIGIGDGIAVMFELAIVALLVGWGERLDLWLSGLAPPGDVRTAATSGLVAILGVACLATTIALVDIAGHGHAGADHDVATIRAPR